MDDKLTMNEIINMVTMIENGNEDDIEMVMDMLTKYSISNNIIAIMYILKQLPNFDGINQTMYSELAGKNLIQRDKIINFIDIIDAMKHYKIGSRQLKLFHELLIRDTSMYIKKRDPELIENNKINIEIDEF